MRENIFFISSIIFVTLITIISCNDEPKQEPLSYRYAYQEIIPDSLRDDMAKFITETMRAADQHLTTSDYEDVDDVVEEIRYTAKDIYSIPVEGLEWNNPNNMDASYWKFIPHNQLTTAQKQIFDSLKIHQQ